MKQFYKWYKAYDPKTYVQQWDRSFDDLERHLKKLVKQGSYERCCNVFKLPVFSTNYDDNMCVQQRVSRAVWQQLSLSEQQDVFQVSLLELFSPEFVSEDVWQGCSPDEKQQLFRGYLLSLSNQAVPDMPFAREYKTDYGEPAKPTVDVDDLAAMKQHQVVYFWEKNGIQMYNSAKPVLRKHILDSLIGPMLFDMKHMGEADFLAFQYYGCEKSAFKDPRNDGLVRHIVKEFQDNNCRSDTRDEKVSTRRLWYTMTPIQRYMWFETMKEYLSGLLLFTPNFWEKTRR
jgi:hypothetical protein